MAKTWTNSATAGTKATVALIDEIKTAIDSLWMRRGTAVTSGTAGTTITLTPAEATVNYDITLTWNIDPTGDVGHVWILPAEKLVGSFIVRNQGASGIAFTWTLTRVLA